MAGCARSPIGAATPLLQKSFTRIDLINITGVDNTSTANDQTFAYTATNRLSTAVGEWGSEQYATDAAGNRLSFDRTITGTTTELDYFYGPVQETSDERFEFNIIRCRYAETYKEGV